MIFIKRAKNPGRLVILGGSGGDREFTALPCLSGPQCTLGGMYGCFWLSDGVTDGHRLVMG